MKKIIEKVNVVSIDDITSPDQLVGIQTINGDRAKIMYSGNPFYPFCLGLFCPNGFRKQPVNFSNFNKLISCLEVKNMYLFDNESELYEWLKEQ